MLTVEQEKIDLGTLRYQETYRFEVKISNNSESDTEIISIIKGCGKCTQISIDSMNIPSKGFKMLKVEFTPDHITQGNNKITKSITVNYKNELKKNVALRIYFEAKVILP